MTTNYNIYFKNRVLTISDSETISSSLKVENFVCKNSKSFDKAYNDFINKPEVEIFNLICKNPAKYFKKLKKKFKVIKAAGGIVLNSNNQLLVIKRQGYWDLPKGKIEKSELKKIAAIREVEEECGIDSLEITGKFGKTYHTYKLGDTDILKITYWYKMTYKGDTLPVPQTEEDITEVKWVSPVEIEEIKLNTHKNLLQLFDDYS